MIGFDAHDALDRGLVQHHLLDVLGLDGGLGRLLDGLAGGVEIVLQADGEIDAGQRVALGEVAHALDLAVADEPHGAVDIPQRGQPQGDILHVAHDLTHVDGVAHTVLVLHEHEDAGKEILHQGLCTKADGQSDNSGGGDNGCDVDA